MEESTVKDNFSTIYQLLEELLDFGVPLTTEPNALKALVKPPSIVSRLSSAMGATSGQISDVLPDGTISNMPWRMSGVSYTQNEIYLDIVEEVDSTLSVDGRIVSSEVSGVIQANSRLSGVPDLALQFSDPRQIDDCSFHPCVRYNRFERDQVVSFVPPDGPFELMRYRVLKRETHAVAPCYCSPSIEYDHENNRGTITLLAGTRGQSSLVFPGSSGGGGSSSSSSSATVEDVTVTIPFMRSVRTANLKANEGTVLYDEATKVAKWKIGNMASNRPLKLTGTMILQERKSGKAMAGKQGGLGTDVSNNASRNSTGTEESPPIQMDWTVPMASLSGMSVASLSLSSADYKPYKGVRTLAKSGKFQIRTA